MSTEELTFDLVVATLDRTAQLDALLTSLDLQTHRSFRVVVVDQNEDDRVAGVLEAHPELELLHLRSAPGLSRARNVALPHLRAKVVAWPDDDCTYPPSVLADAAEILAAHPDLDGITGRPVDPAGLPGGRWPADPRTITPETVWNLAISHTIFLRAATVRAVGPFDEQLGLGCERAWASGEEIELLVRALRGGAWLVYDPSLVVLHPVKQLTPEGDRALAWRDGASVGYILARHRFGMRTLARMVVRPVGGALLALGRLDLDGARTHGAVLRGRVVGYRAGLRARSSSKSTRWRSSHGSSA